MALMRCNTAFTVAGSEHVYAPGDLLEEDDPIVVSHPGDFEPLEASMAKQVERVHRAEPSVEEATAEPGAKRSRSTKRSRSKAAAKDGE